MLRRSKVTAIAALAIATMALAACGGDTATEDASPGATGEAQSLVVYSGREEELVGELMTQFEADTGVDLDVRYGDSAELAAQILEEGDNSPADVFYSQDAGSLGVVGDEGKLTTLDQALLDRVDPRFKAADGTWIGASGRARVVVYNTDELSESDLPDTIWGFTEPEWKGKVGLPPTNSSFQAFVAGMIELEGEAKTKQWLEDLKANDPVFYEDNGSTTRAVADGEVLAGFVNHYYKYEVAAEDGTEDLAAENHFLTGGDPGALVNASGAGILTTAANPEAAMTFLEYLTGEAGQSYFAADTWEYPVVPGFEPSEDLVPLEEIESPDIDLSNLGDQLRPALDLLAETGYV